jgi:hypothetical protein
MCERDASYRTAPKKDLTLAENSYFSFLLLLHIESLDQRENLKINV